MHRTSVDSSNLAEIAWANDVLYCRFKKTMKWYSYTGVSLDAYSEFANSQSVGQHFHQQIKPNFEANPLDEEDVTRLDLTVIKSLSIGV